MRTILPGKPQAKLQAVCSARWENLRLVAYISGSALVILSSPHDLLQTIYLDEDQELEAVAVDEATGKIATCTLREVTIYKPYGRNEGVLKWSYQSAFEISECLKKPALSWGSEAELLVGCNSLRIYQTTEHNRVIWNRTLPKPVKIATFSYDSTLIATTGYHDRLIKLWRGQSFVSDDTRFDFTYLPHPTAVTAVHWRATHQREHTPTNVLFSTCADSKVRIWAATDPHGVQVLQLWAEIDMQEAIQPRQLELRSESSERYAFIIDSRDFTCGMEQVSKSVADGGRRGGHALEHLLEISRNSPEVCVVLDRRGNMSAWGLENVGCKARKNTDKFNIAHVENVNISFLPDVKAFEDNTQFLSFCDPGPASPLTLLVHHFDGRIIWYESTLDEFFDPTPHQQRLHARALWTGHDASIKKIVRNASGKALLSRTNDNEGLVWKQGNVQTGLALTRSSSFSCTEHIHRSWLLEDGNFVVNLHHHSITLWDSRSSVAKQVACCQFNSLGKPLCLLLLPNPEPNSRAFFVATVTTKMEGMIWKIQLQPKGKETVSGDTMPTMIEFCSSNLGLSEDLAFVLPVDPAGLSPTVSGFLDIFAKDLAISYTNSGTLHAWTATVDEQAQRVSWLLTSTIETDINMPSLASASSIRKIAVVDEAKTGLTIWDPWSAQLEYKSQYEATDTVQDLDWSSTPDDQSILAIGFPYKVVILAQMRYDYLDAGPAWAPIREIRIKELTSHPIGDSTWLGSGNLVIGAGNQLYIYDNDVSTSDDLIKDLAIPFHQHRSLSIFDLVTYLNGPLPVFHPQFLAQCILAGKLAHVQRILLNLHKALKFFVAGDELDSFVSMLPEDFYSEQNVRYPQINTADIMLILSGELFRSEEELRLLPCGLCR